MPTNDVDRLSDLAHAASNLAERSNRLDDHADAAKAHMAAFRAAKGDGRQSRPSLEQTHLSRAAEHDKVAHDADSYAQKRVLAAAAERASDKSPTSASCKKTAAAHREAAKAWKSENPDSGNRVAGEPWELRRHTEAAQRHDDQAKLLAKSEGGEGGGVDPDAIEARANKPAAPASKDA